MRQCFLFTREEGVGRGESWECKGESRSPLLGAQSLSCSVQQLALLKAAPRPSKAAMMSGCNKKAIPSCCAEPHMLKSKQKRQLEGTEWRLKPNVPLSPRQSPLCPAGWQQGPQLPRRGSEGRAFCFPYQHRDLAGLYVTYLQPHCALPVTL